jgi:UDP-N-acetylglucosamine--N-acetylmuramyl-(pentapeptide) pyrophosphoryl-undecaprenol N-acetylglucosamine transferase
MEGEMVKREGIAFEAIPAAGLHGVGLRTLPGNLLRLLRGYANAARILKQFKPDLLLFTGGYVAVPMALAGVKTPSLLYVPDIEPGLALRAIARFADAIAVTTEDSKAYFPRARRIQVTGYPTRAGLTRWDRAKGREFFGIQPDARVLLVFGGSKGAHSINQAVMQLLPSLPHAIHVIHISGQADFSDLQNWQASMPVDQQKRYHLLPYLHEMGAALAAADLVVSRAGASILGEYPLFGLPSILVPYPYAWRYQKTNADYLVRHGAARIVENSALTTDLLPAVTALFSDEKQLAAMRQAALKLARPQAARDIADLAVAVAAAERRTA